MTPAGGEGLRFAALSFRALFNRHPQRGVRHFGEWLWI